MTDCTGLRNNLKMLTFPGLKRGDKIALACPGSRCLDEAEVIPTKAYLESQGFQVIYSEDCYRYLSPEEKARIFTAYLLADDVKMIWTLRGGEGCADLLPTLELYRDDFKKIRPTLLFGFSDFTVLLNYFAFHYDWPVVHGLGAVQFVKDFLDERSKRLSINVALGDIEYCIDGLKPFNSLASGFQDIRAVCAGGNLALLNISIGDVWQFDASNKILIIEDVNEKSYQISRTLKYLQRIGFFNKVKAVIFGDFNAKPIGHAVEEQQKEADNIMRYLNYFAQSVDFPVFYTDKIGHGKVNYPIIFNYPAVLSADGKLSFTNKG